VGSSCIRALVLVAGLVALLVMGCNGEGKKDAAKAEAVAAAKQGEQAVAPAPAPVPEKKAEELGPDGCPKGKVRVPAGLSPWDLVTKYNCPDKRVRKEDSDVSNLQALKADITSYYGKQVKMVGELELDENATGYDYEFYPARTSRGRTMASRSRWVPIGSIHSSVRNRSSRPCSI